MDEEGLNDWAIAWSHDPKTAGFCSYEKLTLIFSTHAARWETLNGFFILIYHEIAHALVGPNAEPHGLVWQSKSIELGGDGKEFCRRFAPNSSMIVCPCGAASLSAASGFIVIEQEETVEVKCEICGSSSKEDDWALVNVDRYFGAKCSPPNNFNEDEYTRIMDVNYADRAHLETRTMTHNRERHRKMRASIDSYLNKPVFA
jgi:hypothetical protein